MRADRPGTATLSPPSVDALAESLFLGGHLDEAGCGRLRVACAGGTDPLAAALELGLVEEGPLYAALSAAIGVPLSAAEAVVEELPLDLTFLARTSTAPVAEDAAGVVIATSDPGAADVLDAIAFKLRRPVRPALATPSRIAQLLSSLTGSVDEPDGEADADRLRALASDGPVIRAVNDLIGKASAEGASDIHIEADEQGAEIRLRIDGTLRREGRLSPSDRAAFVSRLKIMAGLNIAEKRRPQDGRAGVVVRGRPIDLRLSTLPIQHGESVVVRLLDQRRLKLDWNALGYAPERVAAIRRLIAQPSGMVLVSGPTGSGKTTTLYTALAELNAAERKIITVEDPVEYRLRGIVQVQVEAQIDMTFAAALRAILRQDPNVVMVGEIRDTETAEIAVRAAQTGRLVLSTVHTNDAVAAIDRLLDLGVPSYLLGSVLRGVLSQRLVRRLCMDCGGPGCVRCGGAGVAGRVVVSELLEVSREIGEAIGQGVNGGALRTMVDKLGHCSLIEEGRILVRSGLVSEVEVTAATGS
jgi:general secretion pathway protein E